MKEPKSIKPLGARSRDGTIYISGQCDRCGRPIKQEMVNGSILLSICSACGYIKKQYLGRPKYIF